MNRRIIIAVLVAALAIGAALAQERRPTVANDGDAVLAALEDARMRHGIARRSIARIMEELVAAETLNEELRREISTLKGRTHE